MAIRKNTVEKLASLKRKGKMTQENMTIEDLMLLILDGGRPRELRQCGPTQRDFIFDPSPVAAYMGEKGSGKTAAGCTAGFLRSLMTPGSKGLVARNDANDLKQTTALQMQEMLNRLPDGILLDRSKDPPMNWYLQSVPSLYPDGTILDDTPSQITFMGLNAMEEGGSYQFDWAALDEAAEMSKRGVQAVTGLMRNIPKTWEVNKINAYKTMLMFNPTDTNHWLFTACTGMDAQYRKVTNPWIKLFRPQPKENQRNLPSDYYERLLGSMDSDMAERLVRGQWGATYGDAPVYPQFKYEVHAKRGLIERYDKYAPMFRFWDFGFRHPYVCWVQLDIHGRMLVLKELVLKDIEIIPFIQRAKQQQEIWFPRHRELYDYGDPAARQQKDTGSTLTELYKEKIQLRYKISTIDAGLRVVRMWLEKMIAGEPAIQFDSDGVPILISAIRGGYQMDKLGVKPVKDGYYDHPADAFRYGCDNLLGGGVNLEEFEDMPNSLEYRANEDSMFRGQEPTFGEDPEFN
jgi:hypothetical protein